MPEYDPKKLRPQDLRDATVRTLGDAVNGLAKVVRDMSSGTARAAGRGISSAGLSPASFLGIAAGSAIHPVVGSLIKRAVETQQPRMEMAIQGYMGSIKDTINRNFRTQREDIRQQNKATQQNIATLTGSKRRLQNDSYTSMYGSGDIVEALDRLRISNAAWLKALGTMTPRALRNKSLPRAAAGGYVEETGEAVVHKGEVITPANVVRLQTKALLDIRNELQGLDQTGAAVQNISNVMGSVHTDFLSSPLMDVLFGDRNSAKTILLGLRWLSSSIRERRRIRLLGDTVSGRDAYFHYRSIQRNTAIETIAAATAATYAHVRLQGERQISLLKVIAGEEANKIPGADTWGYRNGGGKGGILEGLTRYFLETGDLMIDVLSPISNAIKRKRAGLGPGVFGELKQQTEESEVPFISQFLKSRKEGKGFGASITDSMFGPKKVPPSTPPQPIPPSAAEIGVLPPAVTRRMINYRAGADNSLGQLITISNILRSIHFTISRVINTKENKKRRDAAISDRQYKIRHLIWMDNNRIDDVSEAIFAAAGMASPKRSIASKLAGGGAHFAQDYILFRGLRSLKHVPVIGTVATAAAVARTAYRAAKVKGLGNTAALIRAARKAATSNKLGRGVFNFFKGAKTAASNKFSLIAGGKPVTMAAKLGGVGTKGAGLFSKALAPLKFVKGIPGIGWIIAIVASVIDGIISVFRTGEFFKMSFKNTSLTMKLSAFYAGIVNGFWDLIQMSFNLLFKAAGSNFRLDKDFRKKLANYFYKIWFKSVGEGFEMFSKLFKTGIEKISEFFYKVFKSVSFTFRLVSIKIKPLINTFTKAINYTITNAKKMWGLVVKAEELLRHYTLMLPAFLALMLFDQKAAWDLVDKNTKDFMNFCRDLKQTFLDAKENIKEITSELWQGIKDLSSSAWQSVSETFSGAMSMINDAIYIHVIDPIVNVCKQIGILIGSIPEYILEVISKIPGIGPRLSILARSAFISSQATNTVLPQTKTGLKTVLPAIESVKQILNRLASADTAGQRAIMKNNNENNSSLGKGMQESTKQQIAAVNNSASTVVNNTTSAITNANQDPFNKSPLWTSMIDLIAGASV